jgi:EAL domain-containing protein (putative c-di-GMP-specific phosphodiesterase class I)
MDILENPAHAAIVRSIVDLGHNLRLHVVAEGVETEETLDALREAGCDVAHGFLLARAMAAEGSCDGSPSHRLVLTRQTLC